MFRKGFENCWYGIPRVPGLELSGGPEVPRSSKASQASPRQQRTYIQARKVVGNESDRETRKGRVMLHRAVMTMVLGRQLGRDEFVCHRDDDVRNNWPENLYLGDRLNNAADCLRNGRHARGDNHPCTRNLDAQIREIR